METRDASRAETRSRILEATLELHAKRGILGTSYRAIAELADVSVGTVYNHFPSLDELVPACGEVLMARLEPPVPGDAERLVLGAVTLRERLRAVGAALFAFYERGGAHLHPFPGERELPAIQEWEEFQRGTVAVFVQVALRGRRASSTRVRAATSLFDLATYDAMRQRGVSPRTALSTLVEAAACLLDDGEGGGHVSSGESRRRGAVRARPRGG